MADAKRYVAITGGVGGAKLALGLTQLLGPDEIAFIVNTGDDFEHLGLHVSPDIDTLVYTLSGQSNTEVGWGRRGETWQFMQALKQFGGETWFNLGDLDLAMHVERTQRLRQGRTPDRRHARTRNCARRQARDPADERCAGSHDDRHRRRRTGVPALFRSRPLRAGGDGISLRGRCDGNADPREIESRFDDHGLAGVIICPSNPFVSVDPVLAVPGMRERLRRLACPIVAVSPIVAGTAIKGPTAKDDDGADTFPTMRFRSRDTIADCRRLRARPAGCCARTRRSPRSVSQL